MIVILIVVGSFAIGFISGYVVRGQFLKDKSSGTIHVLRERDKIVYSLELEDYPESIQFKKKVIFDVSTPESLDRE